MSNIRLIEVIFLLAGLFNNVYFIGMISSLAATIIFKIIFRKWEKGKNSNLVALTKEIYEYFENVATLKMTELVHDSKMLGESLISSFKGQGSYNQDLETKINQNLDILLDSTQTFVTSLSSSEKSLSSLKLVINNIFVELQRRRRTINHLCHPPNPTAMDGGHVRDQLLSGNADLLHEFVDPIKGECIIFLRGFGVNVFDRWKNYRRVVKKYKPQFTASVKVEHRNYLRTRALNKAKN